MSQQVEELINLAERVVALPQDTATEVFLETVGNYLDAVDKWQKALAANTQGNPSLDRGKMEKLQGLHEQILTRAGVSRDNVGVELNSLTQREQAMRKYANPFTARISITGKRKG